MKKIFTLFPELLYRRVPAMFIFGFIIACAKKEPPKSPAPISVEILNLQAQSLQPTLSLAGELTAASRHELSFLVAGKISGIQVKEGDQVRPNQVLARLETNDYDQALAIAQAKLDEANDQYERLANMYASGSLPEADFNKIKTLKKEAEANYQLYKNKRKYTELASTIPGTVSRIWARSGMAVEQGQPVLTVLNTSGLLAKVGVPEQSINKIAIGESALILVRATGDTLSGKVEKINPAASRITRSFDVEIALEETSSELKDGMLCTVLLDELVEKEELLVPARIVQTDVDGVHYVFIARNGLAKRQRIIPGRILGNSIIVESGLSSGDQVIQNPPINLLDGNPVSF
ncbi:efflux RND transporter periplasmic adaptor subunit [Algoriphagus namhaensis]